MNNIKNAIYIILLIGMGIFLTACDVNSKDKLFTEYENIKIGSSPEEVKQKFSGELALDRQDRLGYKKNKQEISFMFTKGHLNRVFISFPGEQKDFEKILSDMIAKYGEYTNKNYDGTYYAWRKQNQEIDLHIEFCLKKGDFMCPPTSSISPIERASLFLTGQLSSFVEMIDISYWDKSYNK